MRLRYLAEGDRGQRLVLATFFLFLARITVGSIFFFAGLSKPPPDFNWFPEWVQKEADYAQIGLYKLFLETVVIPNITFFGWMQFVTEIVLGAMVLLGFMTRFSGFLLGVWAFNIALGSYPVPGEQLTLLELFVLMPFLVGALATGRILGLDALLRTRWMESESRLKRFLGAWCM